MASYLVLTPPGGPEPDHRSTRTLRDGFSLPAFLFPGLWFLVHRLWFAGLAALLLQGIAAQLMAWPGLLPAGLALSFAVSLFSALEGNHLIARRLERKGFTLAAAIEARNLDTAEEIFFSNAALRTRNPRGPAPAGLAAATALPVSGPVTDRHRPVLGLFDLDGGR